MGILSAILLSAALQGEPIYAQPSRIYRSVQAGTTVTEIVRVHGAADDASITTMPFVLSAEGKPAHRETGDRDLQRFMHVEQIDGEVRVRIDVPSTAKGTYWAAVVIEMVSSLDPVRVRIRLAIPVVITVEGTAHARCALADVIAMPRGDELEITARIENSGDVGVNAPVVFAIEKDGVEVASVESDSVLLLPGSARIVTVRMPRVDGGEVVAMYRYGPEAGQIALLRGLVCHIPMCTGAQPRVPS
jgi:hypothetical protein